MDKKQFIRNVARRTGLTQPEVKGVLDTAFEEIVNTISAGDEFKWPRFGVIGTRVMRGHTVKGIDGKIYEFPDCNVIKFSPYTALREAANAANKQG